MAHGADSALALGWRPREPLRSSWPVRRASGVVGGRRLGARAAGRDPAGAPRPGRPVAPAASSSTTSNRPAPRRSSRPSSALPPSALVIVFSSPTLEAGTPAFEQAPRRRPSRDIATAPHVARVVPHLLSPRQISADRHTAYDIVFLDLPPDDSPEALPILRERLRDAPGLTVELAGGPAFYGDVQTVSEADLRRSEIISLPLAALALLVVFGSRRGRRRAADRRRRGGRRRAGRHLRGRPR